jgi:hypothetical protein
MGKTEEELFDVVLNGEQVLPEAAASVNMRIDWNGADLQLTLRDFDEQSLLERLVQLKPALEELGMTLKNGNGTPKPESKKGTPKKQGTPKKEEPDVVDETIIEVTSIYINEGKRGNYAFVKGTPGFEKQGAICFDDAWEGTGYSLSEQEAKKFYNPGDFGFVRAVLRMEGGKARVWKFLTSHEQIAF